MATAQDIVERALRLNRKHAPTATMLSNGLISLNDMISSWSVDGLLVPCNTTENLTLVVGQDEYTIGSSGNFDTVRPSKIVNAYIRDSNNEDHPVDVTMTEPEYSAITDKTADARPTRLYYDPQVTLGVIYFDYEPETAETLVLISEKPITEFAALSTSVSLPDHYKQTLSFNLAVMIAPEFDNELPQEVKDIAVLSKQTVENITALTKLMNPVTMDSILTYGVYR